MIDTWEDFVPWELSSQDAIDFKKVYVDVADGDLVAGLLLSQIVYWHLPTRQGASRLRVSRDGHYWLAKGRDEWWDECRITPYRLDRARRVLEKLGLIEVRLWKFDGAPTLHIRLVKERFIEALHGAISDETRNRIWGKPEIQLGQNRRTITETTTQTTEDKAAAPPDGTTLQSRDKRRVQLLLRNTIQALRRRTGVNIGAELVSLAVALYGSRMQGSYPFATKLAKRAGGGNAKRGAPIIAQMLVDALPYKPDDVWIYLSGILSKDVDRDRTPEDIGLDV